MCNLNLFECTQSWLRRWWLSGVSISYAGVLNSFGLGLFHQIFIDLGGEIRKKGECASKYKWAELNLSFSWSHLEPLMGRRSEYWEFLCPGSFVCRVEQGVAGIRRVTKLFTFPLLFFFLPIYSDELINPSLSCHKVPLSVWTYGTKASDAKRWNRAISLQLNCACLFLLTLHQPAPASPLSASVFGSQMWCERSILSDAACYFVSSRLPPPPLAHWWYFIATSPKLY